MKQLPIIALLLVVALFIAGLAQLFSLRFQSGDIYPCYSTLRADPLGTKACYEAFQQLLNTERNYRDIPEIPQPAGSTLFVLGLSATEVDVSAEEVKMMEEYVSGGGRLVFSFASRHSEARAILKRRASSHSATNAPAGKSKLKNKKTVSNVSTNKTDSGVDADPVEKRLKRLLSEDEDEESVVSLNERWKFAIDFVPMPAGAQGVEQFEVQRKTGAALPEAMAWHSPAYFDRLDDKWHVVYARENNRAVVAERSMGRGTIVIASDTYLFSNEALRKERQPAFLAWVAGPSERLIFDETHLGVQMDPGVSFLVLRYRLHWAVMALIVLALLFIWKNSVPFLPPREGRAGSAGADHVEGREASAGFTNLLRRGIARSEILSTCMTEWQKTCGRHVSSARLQQVQQVLEQEKKATITERDPVGAYKRVCALLSRRGKKRI